MVEILMAVYNGEHYLAEQLDSILAQTRKDWRLIIRDDGSTDGSLELLRRYEAQNPARIRVISAETNSGSAKKNFFELMKLSTAQYVMFSDQDDYWMPDKLRLTLHAMRSLENHHPDEPLLVHTDLIVADNNLKTMNRSMFRYQGLSKTARSLPRLLCQNNITGCTMMANRRLIDLSLRLLHECEPDDVLMHDWWLGVVAAGCGHIGFLDTSTISYRQHGDNTLGAIRTKSPEYVVKSLKARGRRSSASRVGLTYVQAHAFLAALEICEVAPEAQETVSRYVSIPKMPKFRRIWTIIRYGFRKQNAVSFIGQLVFC